LDTSFNHGIARPSIFFGLRRRRRYRDATLSIVQANWSYSSVTGFASLLAFAAPPSPHCRRSRRAAFVPRHQFRQISCEPTPRPLHLRVGGGFAADIHASVLFITRTPKAPQDTVRAPAHPRAPISGTKALPHRSAWWHRRTFRADGAASHEKRL